MEKRHLMRIIFYELLISYASSLVIGILLGIVLDKILLLVLGLMLPLNIPKGFSLTWSASLGNRALDRGVLSDSSCGYAFPPCFATIRSKR